MVMIQEYISFPKYDKNPVNNLFYYYYYIEAKKKKDLSQYCFCHHFVHWVSASGILQQEIELY